MSDQQKQDIIAAVLFISIVALIIWVAMPYGVQAPNKIKFAALDLLYFTHVSLVFASWPLVRYCWRGSSIAQGKAQILLRNLLINPMPWRLDCC